MSLGLGGNGQWVRARTEEGAKALLAERQMEADRRRARELRFEHAARRAWGWVRAGWRRLIGRARRR